MYVDLKDIGPEGRSFDEALRVPALEGASDEEIEVVRARLSGEVLRGDRGLEFFGRLEATVRLECSRCLERFLHDVRDRVHLTLVDALPEPREKEAEVTAESADLFQVQNERVDLVVVAEEQIYLNLPLKPVCRGDCRGLCPRCGANRNTTDCGCVEGDIDPRLAPLLRFKQRRTNS